MTINIYIEWMSVKPSTEPLFTSNLYSISQLNHIVDHIFIICFNIRLETFYGQGRYVQQYDSILKKIQLRTLENLKIT